MDARRPGTAVTVVAAALLVAAYLWAYLAAPAVPHSGALGWWGWFDQGKTLESAEAFARLDLDPARHWYPPGYALLGAPFIAIGFRAHPFLVPDLACLLLSFAAFLGVARCCGVGRGVAAGLFLLSALWDRQVFSEWVIPWNTTAIAALLWAILWLAAGWLEGRRRPVALGLLAGTVPLVRPTEVLFVGLVVLWLVLADLRARQLRVGVVLGLAAGLLPLLLGLALHLLIYGPHPSPYMENSQSIGFTLDDWGRRAFVILADPYPWFTDGQGLLKRLPWAALGLTGMIPALVYGGPRALLAAVLLAHLVLYVSYVDLLPVGLWRYNNVHYWIWALPGYALLGWTLLRPLAHWPPAREGRIALAALAGAAVLALVRVAPQPIAAEAPARMLEFHGEAPWFSRSYFGDFAVADAAGTLRNIADFRAFPVLGGMRVIANRRPFEGVVRILPGSEPLPAGLIASIPDRFGEVVVLGRPCWLPRIRCGRREPDPLLPPG